MIKRYQVATSKHLLVLLVVMGISPTILLADGPFYYASAQGHNHGQYHGYYEDEGDHVEQFDQYTYDQHSYDAQEYGQWQNRPLNRTQNSSVIINQKRLTAVEVRALSSAVGSAIQPGEYWYDQRSGAWGNWCGPTAGFIQAGMQVGGKLSNRASCGQTGVFINGREIDNQDYFHLVSLLGPISPGRYWVDANGNAGQEGGAAIVNLRQAAAQQQQKSDGVYRYKSSNASGLFSSGCSGMTVKQPNGSSASAYVGC